MPEVSPGAGLRNRTAWALRSTLPILLSIGTVVLYWGALTVWNPRPIADEDEHFPIVLRLARGDWSALRDTPMLPTCHLLAAALSYALGTSLTALRAANVGLAILALLVYRHLARQRWPSAAGPPGLHLAWNPILFPFLALLYTETLTVLALLVAIACHQRRRFGWSGAALLAACLVRQTMVVWVVFMAVWAILEVRDLRHPAQRDPREDSVHRWLLTVGARIWPHAGIVVLAAAALIWAGRPTVGAAEFNQPNVNIAQYYLFALFVGLLWAPVWISHCVAVWNNLLRTTVVRPAGCAALVACIAILVKAYHSPHAWNYDLHYVRNWPLEAMSYSLVARIVAAGLIVALVPLVVHDWRQRRRRRELALVWLFSALFLLPHAVAEPRYYIVPAIWLNFFADYTRSEARWLTCWYGLLSAALAAYVVVCGSAAGGVW